MLAKFGNSAPVLSTILIAYLNSWQKDLQAFHDSAAKRDSTQAAKDIHRLKGALGYFASESLFARVQMIEEETKKGDFQRTEELQTSLQVSMEEVAVQLREILESLS